MHYLIYGHGGSYNHGAEALTRTTIALLRSISADCKITLSTHFAEQDREFNIDADEFIERDMSGSNFAEIYAPTINKITPGTICIHIGGDNYCYNNWQRWQAIHYAAIERGAKSVLWSCSIEPGMIDGEMFEALRSHHLITARESRTYNALIERGLANVVKVSDIAFTLEPEQVSFELSNYVALNLSPLIVKRNPKVMDAYRALLDYLLRETDMNIALVPHVVQPVDNDCEALQALSAHDLMRVKFVSGKLSAGQYKTIIGKARFCVTARTHAAIAGYSSCVPTLAVGYSVKSQGIADDLGMGGYVLDAESIVAETALTAAFKTMAANEKAIVRRLKRQLLRNMQNALSGDKFLKKAIMSF